MAQTPQQRKANIAYARAQEQKMGKPPSEIKKKQDKAQKPPIPRIWVYLLLFVVCGGIIFELVRIIWGAFGG
ncbi:hypothetical protein LTR37_014963 [Vermiconidia calcicola]|uniref:Uncharacterized protein n=2 Tax=Vermiconidia calcicola TaxID=1690605 RepID=A0ACC3MSC6_9PEZI|nr:hypothetical protein LTR37_016165 [Vermiconidia calcicola]KAK3702389.1 hypothetical protein LTR37_014963 [Vermiconidia calcicola]